MIYTKTLECVELICGSVKENSFVLGGILVIATGSFYQLPLVSSLNDEWLYAFQSSIVYKNLSTPFQIGNYIKQNWI